MSKRIDLETTVAGIPSIIKADVTYIKPWGNIRTAPSDWDYYGGYEIEYKVCDSKGRPAPWLEDKVTGFEDDRIKKEVIELFKS